MKIQKNTNTNFKGYDARALKGFLMSSNCNNIASEMRTIGVKEGFKIYTISKDQLTDSLPKCVDNTVGFWAQDYWMIVKNKLLGLEYDKRFYAIKNVLGLKVDFTEKICHETEKIRQLNQNIWDIFDEIGTFESSQKRNINDVAKDFEIKKMELLNLQKEAHVPGGNVFIVRGDKEDELLLGENELKNFSLDEIKSMFSCNKVTVLPQMDYHLDLFIRPLDKKRILVADDNMTLQLLEKGLQKLTQYISTLSGEDLKKYTQIYLKMTSKMIEFKNSMEQNSRPNADLIVSELKKAGYKPIRVAGRFYNVIDSVNDELTLQHLCNFINANVVKNDKNDIVYITNKSNIDQHLGLSEEVSKKIDFSFENEFVKSISKYIKPNKIYFVKGDNDYVAKEMLTNYLGGIHCACMEIPKRLK